MSKSNRLFQRGIPVLLALCIALSITTLAQTATQGSISGATQDATGAVVPNATVKIVNDATNAVVELKSNGSGEFVAPLLDPGVYTVTVNAEGFGTYRENKVIVQVGQTTELSTKLTSGATSTVIEVTAEAPVLNFDSPDFSSNINSTALQNLPINNRRWSALALLTPGVTVDTSGFGLISVRGVSTILNNVEIDGADDNQAYFSEERGRTREAYSTSGSAVREFEVNSGVYPAEFGRAGGGVVNSVTKSGTNGLHGEAYFYDRESNWNAFQDQTAITTLNPTTGQDTTTPIKPEDLRKIYGFTVGGALIKDKLFWIYTYDQHTHIFPFLGVPNNPKIFYQAPDALGGAGDSACTTTGYLPTTTSGVTTANASLDQQVCTLAARLSTSGQTTYGHNVSYSDALALYNSGISALNSDIGLIPRGGYQEINTPKLDWAISPKERVSFLYHRLRWDSPGGVQTSASGGYSLDSTGTDFVKLDYGVTKLISEITPNISNELLYQYGRELNDEGQQPTTAYDTNNLIENGNDPYISLDDSNGFFVGSPYYSYRPKFPDERKWQIGDVVDYVRGRHNFKFGADLVHNYDLTDQSQYYEGEFTYSNNFANYFADLYSKGYGQGTCNSTVATAASASATAVGSYPCYTSLFQGYGPPSFDFATLDSGYFAEDDWKLLPRLTLQLGVRYDYENLPQVHANLAAPSGSFVPFKGINNNPSDKNNFGPRIGFSYDVFGKGKTVLRGGYGLYYGRITNGNEGTALSTTGSPLSQTSITVNTASGLNSESIFPFKLSAAQLNSTAKPTAYFRANNLQAPQIHEFDLIVQQEVGKGTVVQASYLGALGRELPNFLDVNLNPETKATVNIAVAPAAGTSNYGPLGNNTIPVSTFTGYGNTALLGPSATNFGAITELVSNVNSSYNALAVEVQNRTLHSVQFDVNYTWAHSLDYSQNASTAGNTNGWYDPYGSARTNYGNSQWDIKDRMVAYAVYNFPNTGRGTLMRYLANDWKLDDTLQIQTGLPFSASGSGTHSQAVLGDWNGNGNVGLIPQLGLNNHFQPRTIVDDVRMEKDLSFQERYRLQLIGQAFNLANHQNASSVFTTAYKLSGTTASYQADFGQTSFTNNSGFSYTPRQVELSLRLSF